MMQELLTEKSLSELHQLAKVAEVAERYPDMCLVMHRIVTVKCNALKKSRGGWSTMTDEKKDEAIKAEGEQKLKLEVEDRNLLSVAYKNVVGTKRTSWRQITHEAPANDTDKLAPGFKQKYQMIVEKELEDVCKEALALLEKGPCELMDEKKYGKILGAEGGVFYLKMCGDYYRYLAEFQQDQENAKQKATEYYDRALTLAEDKLPETHPTRLGLALNYSVCYYEILKQKDKACSLAKKAFDAAIEKLDTLNDASYKDSTLIMQLLRDNLTLWTSNDETGADIDEEPQN